MFVYGLFLKDDLVMSTLLMMEFSTHNLFVFLISCISFGFSHCDASSIATIASTTNEISKNHFLSPLPPPSLGACVVLCTVSVVWHVQYIQTGPTSLLLHDGVDLSSLVEAGPD